MAKSEKMVTFTMKRDPEDEGTVVTVPLELAKTLGYKAPAKKPAAKTSTAKTTTATKK